jgi:hypothetical protein
MAAGIATHAVAIEFFPERGVGFADSGVGGKDVLQRGHNSILRRFYSLLKTQLALLGP